MEKEIDSPRATPRGVERWKGKVCPLVLKSYGELLVLWGTDTNDVYPSLVGSFLSFLTHHRYIGVVMLGQKFLSGNFSKHFNYSF